MLLFIALLFGCIPVTNDIVPTIDEPFLDIQLVQDYVNNTTQEDITLHLVFENQLASDVLQERLWAEQYNHYRDFRYFDIDNIVIYFNNQHSIKVTSTSNLYVIHILEDTKHIGQLLSSLPHIVLNDIEEIVILNGYQALQINNSTLTMGRQTLLGFTNPAQLFNFLFKDFITKTNLSVSQLYYDKDIAEPSLLQELIWIKLMYDNNLLLQSEKDLYYNSVTHMDALVKEHTSLTLLDPDTFNNLLLAPHNNPNIDGNSFYKLIHPNDPSSFLGISYHGLTTRYYEKSILPDGCIGGYHCFEATNWVVSAPYHVHNFQVIFYPDRIIEFNVDSSVTVEKAEQMVTSLAHVYGQVPQVMLLGLQGVIIIEGKGVAWGGPYHGFHTLPSFCGFCDLFKFHDLGNVVLHELAHATMDADIPRPNHYGFGPDVNTFGLIDYDLWTEAARQDGVYISEYAEFMPEYEDIAETILVYIAVKYYTHRIGMLTESVLRSLIPNRMLLLDTIFNND